MKTTISLHICQNDYHQKDNKENLVVQWLRHSAFAAGGPGSIPSWGTKIHKLHGTDRKKRQQINVREDVE